MVNMRHHVVATYTSGAIKAKGFFTAFAMNQWIKRQKQKDCQVDIFIMRKNKKQGER